MYVVTSGSLQCDTDTSHALPGATINCTCNVTAHAVTQFIVNNTCIISLSTTPPCTGVALSHGTCGDYISATTNGNACAISNLTIIVHPSVNNTQIGCKDSATGIVYSINLIIPGEGCAIVHKMSIHFAFLYFFQ